MDMGTRNATATLVGLADGTTSLYLSTGGAVIGGGEHPQVAGYTLFGHRRHPLADTFHAAHDVITQLRLLDEARQR